MKVLFWSILAVIGLQNPQVYTTIDTDTNTNKQIERSNLYAQEMTEGVLLSWDALLQENNIEFYSIERSVDGFAFEEIAVVEVENVKNYEFVDETASTGTNFYRVAKTSKSYLSNLVFANTTVTVKNTLKLKDTASLE